MKRKYYVLILLVIFYSCKDTDSSKLLQTDYMWQLQFYYQHHSKIETESDFNDFLKFLEQNKQDHFNVTKPEEYQLKLIDGNKLKITRREKQFFNRVEAVIDLDKDIPDNDMCSQDRSITFLNKYKEVQNEKFVINLKDSIESDFGNLVYLPFDRLRRNEEDLKKRKLIIFKYSEENLSVFCARNSNQSMDALKVKIHKSIESFIKTTDSVNFDYALIPVEVN